MFFLGVAASLIGAPPEIGISRSDRLLVAVRISVLSIVSL
jgi:hypothetical protein